jgi:hypothetical protein
MMIVKAIIMLAKNGPVRSETAQIPQPPLKWMFVPVT